MGWSDSKCSGERHLAFLPNVVCKPLESLSFCGFASVLTRFPQGFPHFLCKERIPLTDESRFIAGKVQNR